MSEEPEKKSRPEGRPEPKSVRLVARILYSLEAKGASGDDKEGAEDDAADDEEKGDDKGFNAAKKEYMKKARNLVRRLEKKGAKIVVPE